MKKHDDCAVNSGTSCEEDTYVNLENLRAEKKENIPNRKGTPAAEITQHQVILILAALLIFMFLILVVLTSLLFSNYKSISEEVSQMKNNDTEIMKSKLSELEKRDAEDTKIMKSQLNELKNRDAEDTKIMKSQLNELKNRDAEDTRIMKSKLNELENKDAEDTRIMKSKLSELENKDAEDTRIMKSKLSELENKGNRDAEDTRIMKSKLSELENRAAAVNQRTLELQGKVENLKKSRSCENGWVEFEGHCYFFSGFELNWSQAEKMCLNRGSHLVIINSQAEQNFLQSKTNRRYHWIGLTDLEKEGTFKWVDGTGLSYTSWGKGEPNDEAGKEDCGHLYNEGKWNDKPCDQNIYAICEKNLI